MSEIRQAERRPSVAPGTPVAATLYDPWLHDLRLPARMLCWAERNGIETLGQLARIAPGELLAERYMGRLTVAQTRRVIEAQLGAPWEVLAAGAVGAPALRDAWDELRGGLPAVLLDTGIDEVDLPARAVGVARREGLSTLADLAARSTSELRALSSAGPDTVRRVVEAVAAFQARAEARRRVADTGLLESWKALILELEGARRRLVLTRRAGLDGPPEMLRVLGERLGVSREAVRQAEERALEELRRERAWLGAVRERVDAVLLAGAAPLSALAEDPWWAGIAAMPGALDYFGERVLEGGLRVVVVDEEAYVARSAQPAVDEAWESLRDRAERVPLPAPWEAFEALLGPTREQIGEALAGALFERLAALLHVEANMGGRVTAVGDKRAAAIFAILRASPVPVRVEDLSARVGRGHLPDEVLWLGHALIGLPQHFPDLEAWRARLVPASIGVMKRDGPGRQWGTDELLEALRREAALPDWMTGWHLASLLRRSGEVRYLGRNCVALPDAPDVEERVQLRAELVRLLRDRGGPMTRAELVGELHRKRGAKDAAIVLCLARSDFLRIDADRYGLVERDLPGGPEALAKAADHVARLLDRRQRGLGAALLSREVKRLGRPYARWTPELCLSALRGDARFRLSRPGGVGLSSWESARLPSRREIMRQCLDDGGGRVRVQAVERQIEAYHGSAPGRVKLAMMANQLGAALRGDWLVRAAEGGTHQDASGRGSNGKAP